MKFIKNYQLVLREGYSMWLAYFASIFGALSLTQEQVVAMLPALQGIIPDRLFSILTIVFTVLIPLGRIIQQFPAPPAIPTVIPAVSGAGGQDAGITDYL